MSAIVERIQKTYEEENLFKQSTKNLVKASRKIKDSGQEYAEAINNFADELINLLDKPCATKIPNLCTSLISFGQTLKTVAKLQRKLSLSLTDVLETPLSNFLLYDFGEMEHLKHTVEKAANDYQVTIVKLGKGIVNKKGRLDEDKVTSIEQELGRMKSANDEAIQKFDNSIRDIDNKKQTKLLNCLVTYMRSQQSFFTNAHNELNSMSSTLDELESQIGEITSQSKGGNHEGLLSRLTSHGVWHKNWFVLKDCHLYRYRIKKEFNPESALSLLMCTVRVPPKTKQSNKNFFEIIQAGKKKPVQLQAETAEERDAWVKAIQESISQALNAQEFSPHLIKSLEKRNKEEEELTLKILQSVPGNSTCADCNWKDPDWASINLGVLVCLECSGVHRSLGTHITKVRSLTLDKLDAELVLFMKALGNEKVNKILEHSVGSEHTKPTPETERALRERWIQNKYRNKLFLPPLKANTEELSKELYGLVSENKDKLEEMLLYLLQGANVNWENKEDSKKTPLHQAVAANNLLYCELLVQNGADVQAQDDNGQTPIHVAASSDYYLCLNRLLRLGKLHVSRLVDDFKGVSPLELAHVKRAENCIKIFAGGANVESFLTPEGKVEHVWRQDDSDDSDDDDELPVVLDDEVIEKKENPLFKIKRKRRDSQPVQTRPKSGSIGHGLPLASTSSSGKPTQTLSGDLSYAGKSSSKGPMLILDPPSSGPQGLPFIFPERGEKGDKGDKGDKGFMLIPPKLSLGTLSSSAPTVSVNPGLPPAITPKSGRYKEGGVTVMKTVTGGFTGIVDLDSNGNVILPDPSLAPGSTSSSSSASSSSSRKENRKSTALDIGKSLDKIVKKKGNRL